jgi:hypothetical protein
MIVSGDPEDICEPLECPRHVSVLIAARPPSADATSPILLVPGAKLTASDMIWRALSPD